MGMNIERDQRRFRQIVRGRIREESAEVHHARRDDRPQGSRSRQHSRSAARRSALPLRRERLRRRRAGRRRRRRAARQGRPAAGRRRPGAAAIRAAATLLEVDVSLDELAEMLGEELELPRIEPKGAASIIEARSPSTTASARRARSRCGTSSGPICKALKRQISAPASTSRTIRASIPIKADKQYRSWNTVQHPQVNAAVIYMMDVSGSMTDEQKEIVRTEAFWIDTWLVEPIQRHRNALHHSRRRGEGSRRAHLLPHPRERRHADQLGLQGCGRPDRREFPALGVEPVLLPVLRRRQLGRRQRGGVRDSGRTVCCRS